MIDVHDCVRSRFRFHLSATAAIAVPAPVIMYDALHARTLAEHRDVVLESVTRRGTNLGEVDPHYGADRDIVLAAVRQDGLALQFAAVELQGDRDVVMAAVMQHGPARLRIAS